MTNCGIILDVGRRNGDAALSFFRRIIYLVEILNFAAIGCRTHPRQRSRQRRLAMVNVTNRTHVYVSLIPLKFFLRHNTTSLKSKKRA